MFDTWSVLAASQTPTLARELGGQRFLASRNNGSSVDNGY
jgi:hypothetical protein